MYVPRYTGVVRVTNPREEIEQATAVAFDRNREGYSPEALVLAVDEVLHNMPLARAIVVYVQSMRDNQPAIERPFSWFMVLVSIGFALLCAFLVVFVFRWIGPSTGFLGAFGVVVLQSILLSSVKRGIRLALMSAIDGLNNASYPTNLHPLRTSVVSVDTLRLRRLRMLVLDTADRIAKGERPDAVASDLAEVNLTPGASRLLVKLARVNLATRDYLPPYENRWLAYLLAFAFLTTCIVMADRAGDHLAEGYENYTAAVAGMIAVKLTATPRRRLPEP